MHSAITSSFSLSFVRMSLVSLFIVFLILPLSGIDRSKLDEPPLDNPRTIFELLSQDEILEISITTDIGELIENKYTDDWRPGVFTVSGDKVQLSKKTVKLRPRGKYRLKVCDFPPIKMKFDKDEFEGEGLSAHESLKLVTHCKGLEESESLILKEYLAYKIYNIVTNQSLRVQLAKITWIDSKGVHQIGEKWGFIIESEKQMAKRIGGKVKDVKAVSQSDLDATSAATSSFYQYMIGNPDWKLAPRQNLTVIKRSSEDGYISIPYDFDFSGLVDAPYAVSGLGLTSVQERIYLGASKPEELDVVKGLLKSKKKEIISLVKSFEHLNKSSRREVLKYVRSFYATINYPIKGIEYYQERLTKRK